MGLAKVPDGTDVPFSVIVATLWFPFLLLIKVHLLKVTLVQANKLITSLELVSESSKTQSSIKIFVASVK